MTPFRNEKNSNWEGAYRVPSMVRWPGKIKPGQVSNEMVGHHDLLPTILAMAGDAGRQGQAAQGLKVGDMTYKVHLDGYNLVPYLTGQAAKSPREVVPLRPTTTSSGRVCATTTGSSCSWSSAPRGPSRLGGAVHHACACRRSSTCAPIPMSGRISHPTPITTGCWTTPSVGAGAGLRRQVPHDLQGFPAAPEGGQLQHGQVMQKLKEPPAAK